VASLALPARKPSAIRSWAGRAALAAAGIAKAAVRPHQASLRRLADIPLTAAGTVFIDFAGFHISHGWGWLILGASLVVLEHLIADDTDGTA
jgi:hypothetical protein